MHFQLQNYKNKKVWKSFVFYLKFISLPSEIKINGSYLKMLGGGWVDICDSGGLYKQFWDNQFHKDYDVSWVEANQATVP